MKNGFAYASLGLALLSPLSGAFENALARTNTGEKRWVWQGTVTGPPISPASPLHSIPNLRTGARRLELPAPRGPIPKEALIPLGQGGGTITLLARYRDGWLVGTNAGEWGGGLFFVTPSKRVEIARGSVIGAFSWKGHLFVLSGLRHLGMDDGEVWQIDRSLSKVNRRIVLPGMPSDVIISGALGPIVRTAAGDVVLR